MENVVKLDISLCFSSLDIYDPTNVGWKEIERKMTSNTM